MRDRTGWSLFQLTTFTNQCAGWNTGCLISSKGSVDKLRIYDQWVELYGWCTRRTLAIQGYS